MIVISNSFSSGKRPGCVYEVDDDVGREQVLRGIAAPVIESVEAPPEPEPEPEVPVVEMPLLVEAPSQEVIVDRAAELLEKALSLEPWPKKGWKPETYLKLAPLGRKAALAREHVEMRKALGQEGLEMPED